MLSAALRRNAGNSAFQNLQKCLLYAFTGYVSGDGRVFRLPCDLIDFIDVDDTAFRFVDIIVGSLDQAQENVFDVFADIAGFGQGRCIGNRKRNVQETRERLGKERLAAACRPEHDDIGLLEFYIIVRGLILDSLVMVVYGNGQSGFGIVLFDDVLIHVLLDFFRNGKLEVRNRLLLVCLHFLFEDVFAHFDTFIADIDSRPCDQLFNFFAGTSAEAADRCSFMFLVQWEPPLFLR